MNKNELQKILDLHKNFLNQKPDGVRADLRNADLRCADLSNADLRSVYLEGADLRGANLRGADLSSADLRSVYLEGADLSSADLRGADLYGADLRDAKLRWADLRGADLRDAKLRNANLRGADLDFSCLPLWCGSLRAGMDDEHIKQLLYHVLSIVKHSRNVSGNIKSALLTEENLKLANEFHRVDECGKL
jgi:uncharacterized protein YjbI with pentapeptide repeats